MKTNVKFVFLVKNNKQLLFITNIIHSKPQKWPKDIPTYLINFVLIISCSWLQLFSF